MRCDELSLHMVARRGRSSQLAEDRDRCGPVPRLSSEHILNVLFPDVLASLATLMRHTSRCDQDAPSHGCLSDVCRLAWYLVDLSFLLHSLWPGGFFPCGIGGLQKRALRVAEWQAPRSHDMLALCHIEGEEQPRHVCARRPRRKGVHERRPSETVLVRRRPPLCHIQHGAKQT